ncbi:MAG: biotin/lipoyl-containing protein [Thermoleophilaceae bacterium]
MRASTPSIRATASWPRTPTWPRPARARGWCGSAPRRGDEAAGRQGGGPRAGRAGGGTRHAGHGGVAGGLGRGGAARRGDRLSADDQGELGRRRARDARGRGPGRPRRTGRRGATGGGGRLRARRRLSRAHGRSGRATSRSRSSADEAGQVVHLYERDCSVQRRHQKVVERAPAVALDPGTREEICDAAVRLAREASYRNAGTVEFLQDVDSGRFFFIEVNPRIQVEHTVTEMVTGVDLVKAQIRVAEGASIGTPESGVPVQDDIELNGHALQCRVTTEDPENEFAPDYGRITTYREATGFGIRLDGGTAYAGAVVTPFYDSMLEKITAWAPGPEEAVARMERALREFRIHGVKTNMLFLEGLIAHPSFLAGDVTTRFVDETPELFDLVQPRDRATRLLDFIGDVLVNGNPEVDGHEDPGPLPPAPVPDVPYHSRLEPGTRDRLKELGPEGFSRWMRDEQRLLLTDTSFRDAHQSLVATRVRTQRPAPRSRRCTPGSCTGSCRWSAGAGRPSTWPCGSSRRTPGTGSPRCASGRRTSSSRCCCARPTRSATRTTRTTWCATSWPRPPRPAWTCSACSTRSTGSRTCAWPWTPCWRQGPSARRPSATRATSSTRRSRSTTSATTSAWPASSRRRAPTCSGSRTWPGCASPKPPGASCGRCARRWASRSTSTPTTRAASPRPACWRPPRPGSTPSTPPWIPSSGLTSQPNLGSIVEALRNTPRDTGLPREPLDDAASYWEVVRSYYGGFESDVRAGASEVYEHEMPGGQYTNLRQQARGLGLEGRWREVARAYAQVNEMLGDVVKVTPTSKVVGDLAVFMVTNDLTPEEVLDPEQEIAFPESVVGYFRGDLGQPPGGFPDALQRKVLRGGDHLRVRPGQELEPIELDAAREEAQEKVDRAVSDQELASYLMYPAVFEEFADFQRRFGDVSVLPTPAFFWGMRPDEELAVHIERGKTFFIRFLALGEHDSQGYRSIYFELNGQPREVKVRDQSMESAAARPKADEADPGQVAAPVPGMVSSLSVAEGERVEKGDLLLSIEAMKMELEVCAEMDGVVEQVVADAGTHVDGGDLLLVVQAPDSTDD